MITPSLIIAGIALISSTMLVNMGPSIAGANPFAAKEEKVEISSPQPPVKTTESQPEIKATSIIAIDKASGTILYEKNADEKRPIASITKLATAIETVGVYDLEETVTIPKLPAYKPGDEIIGLKPGETYKVKDLLKALLVNSANDAADSLAIINSGSSEAFSKNMTEKVKEWGIEDVNFNNPSGLKDEGNEATARAVAKMGMLALHNQLVEQLVGTGTSSITSTSGRAIPLEPTNKLLQTGQYKGIKTGYTLASGQCFIGLANVQGHEVITVVLNSPDRFGETQQLVNWIDNTYKWQ